MFILAHIPLLLIVSLTRQIEARPTPVDPVGIGKPNGNEPNGHNCYLRRIPDGELQGFCAGKEWTS